MTPKRSNSYDPASIERHSTNDPSKSHDPPSILLSMLPGRAVGTDPLSRDVHRTPPHVCILDFSVVDSEPSEALLKSFYTSGVFEERREESEADLRGVIYLLQLCSAPLAGPLNLALCSLLQRCFLHPCKIHNTQSQIARLPGLPCVHWRDTSIKSPTKLALQVALQHLGAQIQGMAM